MGMFEDIVKVLDRIPLWKRLGEIPSEVDDLKSRVADLEAKLGGKWPADVCKFCGARAARLAGIRGPDSKGKMRQNWTCTECGQVETRVT